MGNITNVKGVTSAQLCRLTGASYRQIDHWTTSGILKTIEGSSSNPGSGYNREYDTVIVNRVKILVEVSKPFGHRMSLDVLRKVYDNYDKGFALIGENVKLVWKVGDDVQSQIIYLCKRCGNEAFELWKCCPTHTPAESNDIVCKNCFGILHPNPDNPVKDGSSGRI